MTILAAAPGDTRGEYDGVAGVYLPIAVAVAVIVLGSIAFALIRYRARPGRMPAVQREHRAVEVAIAVAIAGVVGVLVATTFAAEHRIQATAPRPDLRVQVTSFRWGWRFTYPDLGGIATVSGVRRPAILRVPAGALVRFDMTTRDVIHAFWIPELRFKRDANPYKKETFDLRFPGESSFLGGECAEFCGLKHSDMRFSVMVMPRDEFDRWVAERRRDAA